MPSTLPKVLGNEHAVSLVSASVAWISIAVLSADSFLTNPQSTQWLYAFGIGVLFCLPYTALVFFGHLGRKAKAVLYPLIVISADTVVTGLAGGNYLYFLVLLAALLVCFQYVDPGSMAVSIAVADAAVLVSLWLSGLAWLTDRSSVGFLSEFVAFNLVALLLYCICRLSFSFSLKAEMRGFMFDQVMKKTPEYVAIIDKAANTLFVSDSVLRLVHAAEGMPAVGRPLADLFDNPKHRAMVNEIMEGGDEWEGGFEARSTGEAAVYQCESCIIDEENGLRLILWHDITPLAESRDEAIALADLKDGFLANVSHEIRTPMNAIKGFSELMQVTDLDQTQKKYTTNIIHASGSLLKIVNELLDLSKIDAGMFELVEDEYALAPFINDVVNTCYLRATDKGIQVAVDVDPQLPSVLVGDSARVKQVIVNLLSNAVKFTQEGRIILSIREKERSKGSVLVEYAVSDTGIGISPQDIGILFDEFVQVDMAKNKSVEGTGLGLPICKRLVEEMGGTLEVASEYGQGSTFSFGIAQGIGSDTVLAQVGNAGSTKVLVLGGSGNGSVPALDPSGMGEGGVCKALEELGVPYEYFEEGTGEEDIDQAVRRSEATHLFYTHRGWDESLRETIAYADPHLKKVVMQNVREAAGQTAQPPRSRVLLEPFYVCNVAEALEPEPACGSREETGSSPLGAFGILDGEVLVVDDNEINLAVCESLLNLYGIEPDQAESGSDAVRMCSEKKYDVVFMDHMMPGMDGVEATACIRDGEGPNRGAPIVALTANALEGMREKYLEQGFSDFMSKPLEVEELNRVLKRFFPQDRIVGDGAQGEGGGRAAEGAAADDDEGCALSEMGLDYYRAVRVLGDSPSTYFSLLDLFCQSAPAMLQKMQDMLGGAGGRRQGPGLTGFRTEAHAMKSSLASIGATKLSNEAQELEEAAAVGDHRRVAEAFPDFQKGLDGLLAGLRHSLQRKGRL